MVVLLVLLAVSVGFSQSTVATWTLTEQFSVSHSTQPIELAFTGGAVKYTTHRVLGPASTEVAWQQLSNGNILVIGSLASGASATWTLQSGAATTATATNPLVIDKSTNYFEVTNGLTGMRVLTPAGNASFTNFPLSNIRAASGSWIFASNPALSLTGTLNEDQQSPPYPTAYSLNIQEAGPLHFKAVATITGKKPRIYQSLPAISESCASCGYYILSVEMWAGHKSILLSQSTNYQVTTRLPMQAAFSARPDTLRFRGHGGNTNPACGYIEGGVAYPSWDGRGPRDAWIDIPAGNSDVSYRCNPATGENAGLVQWMPVTGFDDGWYYMMYNAAADNSDALIGVYSGDPAKMLHSALLAAPGLYTTASEVGWSQKITFRSASNVTGTPYKSHWGIWVGTKADLLAVSLAQPISTEQNHLTGVASLSRLQEYLLTFDDPAGGWKWQYASSSVVADQIARVRNGTSTCGTSSCYYDTIYTQTSGESRTILDMWRTNTQAAVETALGTVRTTTTELLDLWANRDGARDKGRNGITAFYAEGGFSMLRKIAVLNAILMDTNASAAHKLEAKAHLALYANVLWNESYVPIETDTSDTYGTANMPVQYGQYRNIAAMTIASHPAFTARSVLAASRTANAYSLALGTNGSGVDSTWYQDTFMQPTVLGFMLARQQGLLSSLTNYPNWSKNVLWEASAMTPVEPRFSSTRRKTYSNGDGNTFATERHGILGTALLDDDPAASAKAMWSWDKQGSVYGVFFVPTVIAQQANAAATKTDPSITSAHYTNYHSNLRAHWGTANEHSLWFINGGGSQGYHDHRHSDAGQVSIYAHSAPLAIDWGANLYSPPTPGGYMHNIVVRDSAIGAAWDADNPSLTAANAVWGTASLNDLLSGSKFDQSRATFTNADGGTWTREVRMLRANASYPLIWVKDSFASTSSTAAKTLTWNTMATGAVNTPAGSYTPTTRFNNANNGVLPSNGTVNTISGAGPQQFTFTGQAWTQHATAGINWDLWMNGVDGYGWLIGNWSHNQHSGPEVAQFNAVNGSSTFTSFREAQHILRVHGTGAFETLIGPYRKGETPTRTVTAETCGLQVVHSSETACFGSTEATWTDGTNTALAAYDTGSHSAAGITISGGTQEVLRGATTITWKASGATSGTRTITLPAGTWVPDKPIGRSGNDFTLFHAGGNQPVATTVVFNGTGILVTSSISTSIPTGATKARLSMNGEAVEEVICSGMCAFQISAPAGEYTRVIDYVNDAGVVVVTGRSESVTL